MCAVHCGYTPAHSSLVLMALLLHFKNRYSTRHRNTSSRIELIQVVFFERGSGGGTVPSVGEVVKNTPARKTVKQNKLARM